MTRLRATAFIGFFVAISCVGVLAQLAGTLGIGTLTPTRDEWGRPLKGHPDLDITECELVMVLYTTNGLIYPPDKQGNPDPRNPPVHDPAYLPNGICALGYYFVSPAAPPGIFSTAVTNYAPYTNALIFVRIFNRPTLAASSFYGDSELRSVPPKGGSLIFTVYRTDRALDPDDDDGDGLNNSWEKSVGSDPQDPNTDDDEMTDWEEWLAGSDPTRADSMFRVRVIRRGAGGSVVLGWPTVAGRRYRVWYVEGVEGLSLEQLAERGVEITSEPLEAAGEYLEHEIPWAWATDRGYFYVTVEE